MSICRTTLINPEAKIGKNVTIDSYTIIGNCIIGNDCIIHSHVYIGDNVVLGNGVEIFNGAVIGKEPKGAGSTARPIEYDKHIRIGDNSSICPHVIIYYDVEIGENTLIGDGASIRERCFIGNYCIISRYVTLNYNVEVGNYVKIMDLSHITGNTLIEDKVFISALVGTANDNQITAGYGPHILGPHIKESAIIGLGANILPGITIDFESQVGAGGLVTKDVLKNTLVKGIPAK